MKKTIAMLTALMALALTVPVPAHAEEIRWELPARMTVFDESELTRDGDDVLVHYAGKLGRFVIVTDGTAPEIGEDFPGCTVTLLEQPEALHWSHAFPDYGDNAQFYAVTGPTYALVQGGAASPLRTYCVSRPEVLDVIDIMVSVDAKATWADAFTAVLVGSDEHPDVSQFDGIDEAEFMTRIGGGMDADGWDKIQYTAITSALEQAKLLAEKNPDKCAAVGVDVLLEPDTSSAVWGYVSAWDGLGDVNRDGAVNAADAAEVLAYAAQSGLTETAADGTGDANADGITDASDASRILGYTAAAGLDETLPDFGSYMRTRKGNLTS